MKRFKILPILILSLWSAIARADEGMWLPLLLEKLNEKEMKGMGMKISAKDIYNINTGSLKDAIVNLGGFCTGEVISPNGLMLTNHHCGFDAVQDHSSLENNYIKNGFWAKDRASELANPGLFVTFIVRIEDVTRDVLGNLDPSLDEAKRASYINNRIRVLKAAAKKEDYQDVMVKGMFESNQYFLFVTETYRDVRLVGAPPSSIGSFGQDTDNWVWPRHSGDFSLFRIYASKDNKPAEYSAENVPYKPKKFLNISLDGVVEGDFTMVFGFPKLTTEYLHSSAIEQIIEVNNPVKIRVRDRALAILDSFMRGSESIKIQYAAKYASFANHWKKWQGEILGLRKTNAVGKKKAYEAEFQRRVNANFALKSKYGNLLADLAQAYEDLKPLAEARDYYVEIRSKIELDTIVAQLNGLRNARINLSKTEYADALKRINSKLPGKYKEYNPVVDKRVFEVMMELYSAGVNKKFISKRFAEQAQAFNYDYKKLADDIYSSTVLTASNKVLPNFQADPTEFLESIKTDKAILFFTDISETYRSAVLPGLAEVQTRINKLQQQYMRAQMEVMKEKKFYPDADSTLRITYGVVKGYQPRDGVTYNYYTYLDGVMEKYIPGDYEFDVPAKLIDLYNKKDYGQYGKNGRMPVCFIATNHTTGGNSGSPALDAYGNLVGLNFDRAWEGVMSDMSYDPSICRNIMVDIRYVLFIIDKFAGATHLVNEMKLVHPRKKPI